ncbi:MAG: YlxR family protein [Clostridia bacterium]|nr:YlxR family protein [Clostridia bacterium]
MKKRKIPERMCVGCREKKPKRDMVRIVRSPEGNVELDFTGKKSGRGAYICYNITCLEKAQKNKALERALQINIQPELWVELDAALEKAAKERSKMHNE